jgi:Ca2+/Na+ antiporter
VISYVLLKARNAYFMPQKPEDDVYSREFWLFVGALFVIISAFIIAFVTSIPLWNKILGTQYDAFTEITLRHQFYNPWVAFCFIFVLFAMGLAQILKYKTTPKKGTVHKKILLSGLLSFILALGAYGRFLYFSSDAVQKVEYLYFALFMAAVFALLLQWNQHVLFKKRKQIGSALAHVGFSVFLIGVIVSMGQQKVISANQSVVSVQTIDKDFKNNRNIILQKKDTVLMGDYKVVYQDKKFRDAIHIDYQVDYFAKQTGNFLFSLYPFVQMNPRFGNVAEPGTAHFWNKDVFTYLKYADFQVASTDTALIDIYSDKMSWRKLVYQSLRQIEVKQNDSTHFYFSKTPENSIPDFIIYAGELLPLSVEEKQSKNIPAEDVAAVLPLVFSMPQYPDRPYTVHPSIHIPSGKQPHILFSKETIPDLGYEVQMDAKVLNENFVSLALRDTKPLLYNGYSFYFSPIRLIDSGQEKEKLGFLPSDEVYQMPLRFTSAKNTATYQETLTYAVSAQGDVLPNILSVPDIDLDLMIQGFGTEGNIVLLVREKEFLVMEAIEFPAMLLVWFGAFLCFMGVAWSVLKAILQNKTNQKP